MDVADLETQAFLTVAEFAELSRSDRRTVRKGIANGQIPSVKFSGTTRIPVPAVRLLLGLEAVSATGDQA